MSSPESLAKFLSEMNGVIEELMTTSRAVKGDHFCNVATAIFHQMQIVEVVGRLLRAMGHSTEDGHPLLDMVTNLGASVLEVLTDSLKPADVLEAANLAEQIAGRRQTFAHLLED